MKKNYFLLMLQLFLFNGLILGQELYPHPKGGNHLEKRISGKVISGLTESPLSFATIALLNNTNHEVLTSTVSQPDGSFRFDHLQQGDYFMEVHYLGYSPLITNTFLLSDSITEKTFVLKLFEDASDLPEIVVKGKRPLLEEASDRLIYNAALDENNSVLTGVEVLRKVPMLVVDPDGKISARGNAKILILMNGKSSALLTTSPGDALKQIPGEQIKKVEFITNPSARYDAEGADMVLNIVTKKNPLKGSTLSLNSGVGSRGSHLFGTFGHQKNKINLSSTLGGNWAYNKMDGSALIEGLFDQDFVPITEQYFTGKSNLDFLHLSTTLDYTLSPKQSLSLSHRIMESDYIANSTSSVNFAVIDSMGNPQFLGWTDRDMHYHIEGFAHDFGLDYQHSLGKVNHNIWVLSKYSTNQFVNNSSYEEQIDGTLFTGTNFNPNAHREFNLQIDYENPLSRTQTLEAGLKLTSRWMDNDFLLEIQEEDSNAEVVAEAQKLFNQRVMAAYTSYDFNLKRKWFFRFGLRSEYSWFDLNDAAKTERLDFFPNFLIKRKLDENQSLKFAYKRSIARPSIFFLNTNPNVVDPTQVSQGNDQLIPELIDNFELSLNRFLDAGSVNISLYWTESKNFIGAYSEQAGGQVFNKFYNIGRKRAIGTTLWGTLNLFNDKWFNTATINLFSVRLRPFEGFTGQNNSWSYSVSINSTLKLKERLNLWAFGTFYGPNINLQGSETSFLFYHVAAQWKATDHITLSLGMDNPFTKNINRIVSIQGTDFRQTDITRSYTRGIRVGFNYNFGTFGPRSKKKSIKNTDLKDQDSNDKKLGF